MKMFCNRRRLEYDKDSIITTVDYVFEKDVETFHGKEFAAQWQLFMQGKPHVIIEGAQAYYYIDYQHCARSANMYLDKIIT